MKLIKVFSIVAAGLCLSAAWAYAEPKLVRIEDPIAQAMEVAADGRLDEALVALEKAVEDSPEDAEAWASLAVVYRAKASKADARRAGKRVLTVDPQRGRQLLEDCSRAFDQRCAEIHADKEARGLIPYAVVTPWPTPDAGIWARLEKEQRTAKAEAALGNPESLLVGPRLKQSKATKEHK